MRPFVSCLCPTYRRPQLVANALACYLAQDYPPESRELLILDDGGTFLPATHPGWRLITVPDRYATLPEKYNALARLAQGDRFVVWEDDDVALPWHISAHVAALERAGLSKPSRVVCDYSGEYREAAAGDSFHGSLAFRREAFDAAGGWPVTAANDFDRQFLAALGQVAQRADPCANEAPAYVYRWNTSGAYHGQDLMRPDDADWYARAASFGSDTSGVELAPRFDADAWRLVRQAKKRLTPSAA